MASNSRLIIAGLRHFFYKNLNREMIGYKIERDLDEISLEDVRDYAKATNDIPEQYAADSIIPPLFVSRLIHPILTETVLNPDLKMNILKMVHGELEIIWYSPTFLKDRLHLTMEIKEITETLAGELMKISFLISSSKGKSAEAIAGLLIRNPKGQKEKKEEEKKPEILKSLKIITRKDQALEYARASLDNNLIHTSPLFAKLVGLKRPILHGVCAFAITCNELLKNFAGNDKQKLFRMSGRFAFPVYPGDTLTLNCYKGGSEKEILFDLVNESGRTNIKSGRFEYR